MPTRIPSDPPGADDDTLPSRRQPAVPAYGADPSTGALADPGAPAQDAIEPAFSDTDPDALSPTPDMGIGIGEIASPDSGGGAPRRVRVAQARAPGVLSDVTLGNLHEPAPAAEERLDERYRIAQADRETLSDLDWLFRVTGGHPQPQPAAPSGDPTAGAPSVAPASPGDQTRPLADNPFAQAYGGADLTEAELAGMRERTWTTGRNVANVPRDAWEIAAGGALRAAQAMLDLPSVPTVRDLARMTDGAAEWLRTHVADLDRIILNRDTDPDALQKLLEPTLRDLPQGRLGSYLLPNEGGPMMATRLPTLPDGSADPDHLLSSFLQGIVQFATGYGAVGRITRLDNKFWNAFAKATATDFAAFQGTDGNFADLMHFFGLRHEATEWLAGKMPDEEFQNRMKNALAGAPLNLVLPGLFHLAARHRNKQVLQKLTGAPSMEEAGRLLQEAGIDPPTISSMINYGVHNALREANIQPEQFQATLASLRAPGGLRPPRAPGEVPPAPRPGTAAEPPAAPPDAPPVPDAASPTGAPSAAGPEPVDSVLRRLREAGGRVEQRAGEPVQGFGPDELASRIERRLPERLDPGIPDHVFARYMWDNISRGDWESPPPVSRVGEYRPTPRPTDTPAANLDMMRLTEEEVDLVMRAVQTRTRWFAEGDAAPSGGRGALDQARAATAAADQTLRRRLGDANVDALIADVTRRAQQGDPSYDRVLRYVRQRYAMDEDTLVRIDIRRNAGAGDDWLEEHWDQIARRATAGEVSAYYRGDAAAARAARPAPRAAIAAKAEDLEKQLRAFERSVAGKPLKEQAAAIRREFGFFVDPDDLRTGNVFWRLGEAGEFQAAVGGAGAARRKPAPPSFWDDLNAQQRAAFAEMWDSRDTTMADLVAFIKEHTSRSITRDGLTQFGMRHRELFRERRFTGWAPQRLEEFRRLWHEGRTIEAIAEHFEADGYRVSPGVLYRTVRGRPDLFAGAERTSPRGGGILGKLSDRERARFRELWAQTETTMAELQAFVAKATGKKPTTDVLQKLAADHPDEFPPRGYSRLDWTAPRLAELERLWHAGEPAGAISARFAESGFHVSVSTIRNVVREDRQRFPVRAQSIGKDARALLETPRVMALDDADAARAISEALGRPVVQTAVQAARKRYGLTLTVEERASLREATEGKVEPTPNALKSFTERDASDEVRELLHSGEPIAFDIGEDVVQHVLREIGSMEGLVPAGFEVGALVRVRPTRHDGFVAATYRLMRSGEEVTYGVPESSLLDAAWTTRPRPPEYLVKHRFIGLNRLTLPIEAELEPAGFLGRSNPLSNLNRSLRAGVAHEVVHAVFDDLDAALRLRLVDHAERLRVMDITVETYLRATGRADLAEEVAGLNVTRRKQYEAIYADRPSRATLMQEEAVAHLVTLAHAGALPRAILDEIAGDLEAMFAHSMGRSSPVQAAAAGTAAPARSLPVPTRRGRELITFNAGADLPEALRRIPTWEDIEARLPKDIDGHRDVEHLQRRMLEVTGKDRWSALTAAERVHLHRELGGEMAAQRGYQGAPLSPDDIDSLVAMWRYVRGARAARKPESLATFVVRRGGIDDPGGDVLAMIGSHRGRPGLVRRAPDQARQMAGLGARESTGRSLDDWAMRAWDHGFFPEHLDRPTINDFLDALRDDLRTGQVVRAADRDYFENVRIADEMAEDLSDYGITPRHFRTEQAVRDHFAGRRVDTGARAGDEGMGGPEAPQSPEAGLGTGRTADEGVGAGPVPAAGGLDGISSVPPGTGGAPPIPPSGAGGPPGIPPLPSGTGGPPPIPPSGGGRPPPLPPGGAGGPPPLPGRPFSLEFDFNWERWETTDDVKRAAGMLIDAHREDMIRYGVSGGGRGYVQSWAQTEAMARNKDGLRLIFDEAERSGRMFDAAETRALTHLKVSAWEELTRLAEVAARPDASPLDFARMRHMGQLSVMITAEIKGSISEAARSMNILRRASTSEEAYKAQLRAIIEQAGGEDTNRALAESLRDILSGPNGGTRGDAMLQKGLAARSVDAILELRAANLLTGPITWVRNVTTNLVAIPYQILVRQVAGMIGELLHPVDGVKIGEAAQMAAAMRGHWREAFSALGESFVTGESRLGTTGVHMGAGGPGTGRGSRLGAEAWGVPTPATWRNATARPWGDRTAAPEPMAPNDLRRFKTLLDPQLYRDMIAQPTSMFGLGMDMLANAFQAISFRPTGSTDPLFKVFNRHAQLGALALRRAEEQLIRGEITHAQIKDRIIELRRNPTEEMRIEAQQFADYNTFTDQMGAFGQWIEKARQHDDLRIRLLANLLLPFHRTPNRLFAYAFENSPIALLTSKFHAELAAGGARADLALAKLGVGTMALTLGTDLYLDGWITGSSPKTRSERETYERGGFREYALRVPTGETGRDGQPTFTFLPLNNMGGPFDIFLWGAMLGDTSHRLAIRGGDDAWTEHWDRALAGATFAAADMMMNKSVLQGVGNVMRAIVQPEGRAQGFATSMGQSFVPAASGLRYARRTGVPGIVEADPIRRQVNSLMDAVMDITPGLSTRLPPQLDLWGRERTRESGLGPWYDAMAPFFPTTTSANAEPIDREFVRLNYFPAQPRSVYVMRSEAARRALDSMFVPRRGRGLDAVLAAQPTDPERGESNGVSLRDLPEAQNRVTVLAGGTPASQLLRDNAEFLAAGRRRDVARRLMQYGDRTLLEVLNELVTRDAEYQQLRDDQRVAALQDIVRDFQTVARAQVIREVPEIQERRDRMPTRAERAKRAPF